MYWTEVEEQVKGKWRYHTF